MNLDVLREIGEWAAVGFYEGLQLPWPRSYGLALRRFYENMQFEVPDNRLLFPDRPFPHAWTRASHDVWTATGSICDLNHHCGLRVNRCIADAKKEQFPHYAEAIDALVRDLTPRLPHFGGYTHSNPDIRRTVSEGFLAMETELAEETEVVRRELAEAEGAGTGDAPAHREALHLMLSLQDYAAGVRAYYEAIAGSLCRAVEAATGQRRKELAMIRDAFRNCFMTPSRSFLEGLLAVNLTWMLDGCDSIGRFDQALGALFEQDMADGCLDGALARRLLDELWQNFEMVNGWNLQIGGYTPDGRDGCNRLTRECILACGRNKLRRPNVAFRITKDTPDDMLREALQVLREGSGRPALYNDDIYTETLYTMDLGLSREDAREIGFGGCTETMIAGLSNCGSLDGMLNMAKCLELALNDGYDPIAKVQVGPHTGPFAQFATFAQFLAAVKRQMQYHTDCFATSMIAAHRQRFHAGDPKLYRTFFTRDCVRNHRSFEAGGARYNWSVVSYQGIANLIDGVNAVRECIFEQGTVGKEELCAALRADFDGFERVRQVLRAVPKFGNDDARCDRLGADLMTFAWDTLYQHQPPRGGRFLPSCILFATYGQAGACVGALPDGRRTSEPLVDSIGASAGNDTHGPTALLNSVTALPLAKAIGTPVLNVRFGKDTLAAESGLRNVTALIRSYFAEGGVQIQLTVVSREDMLAAQKEPEKYQDLIVRIGGYSEYFTRLDPALQATVIARTEYAAI